MNLEIQKLDMIEAPLQAEEYEILWAVGMFGGAAMIFIIT